MKTLITISGYGPLHALLPNNYDTRVREYVDFEYVETLYRAYKNGETPAKRAEAREALIYLNQFAKSLYDGDKENTLNLTDAQKKDFNLTRNGACRDIYADSSASRSDLTDDSTHGGMTVGDAVELRKRVKSQNWGQNNVKKLKIAPSKPPIKTYSPEELQKFALERGIPTKKQNKSSEVA